MTPLNCKYYRKEVCGKMDFCSAPMAYKFCPFANVKEHPPYTLTDNNELAVNKCKFYREKEPEKYALFVMIRLLKSSDNLLLGLDEAEIQITESMPLYELTQRCSDLQDDPRWKSYTKVKEVE